MPVMLLTFAIQRFRECVDFLKYPSIHPRMSPLEFRQRNNLRIGQNVHLRLAKYLFTFTNNGNHHLAMLFPRIS